MTTAKEHQEQGIKLYGQQDFEAAARAFQQAHQTYDADGEKDMAAEMEVNIGLVHRALGENQQALDIMQTALRTFQNSGDTLRAAKVMGNLGGVYMELGDREQAYNCYRQAADAFQELGEKILYGETLIAMGRMQVREGNVWVGAATYEAGLEQLDKLSGAQKVLKSLIGIKNRLSGGKPS